MTEMVPRMNLTDALYHAAARYDRDPAFQVPCYNWRFFDYQPKAVAAQLREIAARREGRISV